MRLLVLPLLFALGCTAFAAGSEDATTDTTDAGTGPDAGAGEAGTTPKATPPCAGGELVCDDFDTKAAVDSLLREDASDGTRAFAPSQGPDGSGVAHFALDGDDHFEIAYVELETSHARFEAVFRTSAVGDFDLFGIADPVLNNGVAAVGESDDDGTFNLVLYAYSEKNPDGTVAGTLTHLANEWLYLRMDVAFDAAGMMHVDAHANDGTKATGEATTGANVQLLPKSKLRFYLGPFREEPKATCTLDVDWIRITQL